METDRPPSRQGDTNDSSGGNVVKAWPPASLALDNPDGEQLKSQNLQNLQYYSLPDFQLCSICNVPL